MVAIFVCYAGPIEDGERVAPLRPLGRPLFDFIRPTAYAVNQGLFDASVPHGRRYYWKSDYLPGLSDGAIEALAAHAWVAPSPMSYTLLFHLGGALGRVGENDTAFGNRKAKHAANINSEWEDPMDDDRQIRWACAFWDALHPFSTGGVYVNFLGSEGEDRVRAAYGPEKYERLVALKRRYDPSNFFRLNQNITP